MNFKFDKVTFLIVLTGGLLLVAWMIYLPKAEAERRAQYEAEVRARKEANRRAEAEKLNSASQTAQAGEARQSGGSPSSSEVATVAQQAPQEEVETNSQTVTLENDLFLVTIDGLSGSVSSVVLKDERYTKKKIGNKKDRDSGKPDQNGNAPQSGNKEDKAPEKLDRIELFPGGLYRTFELAFPVKSDDPFARQSLKGKVRKGGLTVSRLEDGSVRVERAFANGRTLVQTFALPEKDDYLVACKYVWTNPPSSPDDDFGKLGVSLGGLPQAENLTGEKVYRERLNVEFYDKDEGKVSSVNPRSESKSNEKYLDKISCDNPVGWIGSTNTYFASLLFAEEDRPFVRSSGGRMSDFSIPFMTGELGDAAMAPNAEFTLTAYCGPKELSRMRRLDSSKDNPVGWSRSTNVMNVMHISYWSWFEFLARPMLMLLNWLKSICGSYGVAIILLTLIVRLLCWPVTQKANSSMRRMQKIQPKIKELQEKYKETPMDSSDDVARKKAELNQKMMELYRVEKVNPLGGCLPILLQMPVFIALFSALSSAVELYHVPFLWCKDLSQPDLVGPVLPFSLPFLGQVGFHPLVIAMTVLMIVQQKMTPSAADSTQQKMMMIMPILMLFMFYNLPSGLTLYWTVSQIFSILQMKYGQYVARREEARQAETPQKA